MHFPSFLLSFPIVLSTLHGALAQTQGYVEVYATPDCTNINVSSLVFEGPAPNNCEFSACTTFSGTGVAHLIAFQQPIAYIDGHDRHYGNYTCLMYATTSCTGPSQLVTIPGRVTLIRKSFYESREPGSTVLCLSVALEITPSLLALIEVLLYHSANKVTRQTRRNLCHLSNLDCGLEIVRVSFWQWLLILTEDAAEQPVWRP